MEIQHRSKRLAAIGAFVGWITILLQLYLFIDNRTLSVPETIIRFFSYFTILTNILVAFCFTILFIQKQPSFFSKPSTLTPVAVFILVVGIVYNIILRKTWNPQGLLKLVDELLHVVMPLYFLVYWIMCVNKKSLRWTAVFGWLLFPLAYFIYVLLRGATSEFYPYPFVNVTVLGYPKVAGNAAILVLFFLALSCLFVAVGKWMDRKR